MMLLTLCYVQLILTVPAWFFVPYWAIHYYRLYTRICYGCQKRKFACSMYKGSGKCRRCVSYNNIPVSHHVAL